MHAQGVQARILNPLVSLSPFLTWQTLYGSQEAQGDQESLLGTLVFLGSGAIAANPQRSHATAALMVEKRTHAGPRHFGQVVGIFMAPTDAGAMPTLFQVLTPWVSDGSTSTDALIYWCGRLQLVLSS